MMHHRMHADACTPPGGGTDLVVTDSMCFILTHTLSHELCKKVLSVYSPVLSHTLENIKHFECSWG